MAPHLVRAQGPYKDTRIHLFHHTHTHTHMHYWWWIGKMTDQYSEEKRWVFSFDLRGWRWMPDREMKGVPEHRSKALKGSLPFSVASGLTPSNWSWQQKWHGCLSSGRLFGMLQSQTFLGKITAGHYWSMASHSQPSVMCSSGSGQLWEFLACRHGLTGFDLVKDGLLLLLSWTDIQFRVLSMSPMSCWCWCDARLLGSSQSGLHVSEQLWSSWCVSENQCQNTI